MNTVRHVAFLILVALLLWAFTLTPERAAQLRADVESIAAKVKGAR